MRPRTLGDLSGPYKVGRQINYRDCPECGRDTWKVYVDGSSGLYTCFGCNMRGKLDMGNANVLAELFVTRQAPPLTWVPIELPPFQPLSDMAARHLLEKYGISPEDAARYSLVEGAAEPYVGRIIIPYVGYLGDIIYFNSRTYLGEVPKYKAAEGRHPLYVPGWLAQRTSPQGANGIAASLVLVEGAFDAMKLDLAGYRAAAVGGTAVPKYLYSAIRALGGAGIRIVLDSDAYDKALQLQRRLQPFVRGTVEVVMLPPGADPGSMTTNQLHEVLE